MVKIKRKVVTGLWKKLYRFITQKHKRDVLLTSSGHKNDVILLT